MTIEEINSIEFTISKSTSGFLRDLPAMEEIINQMEEDYGCSIEEIPEINIYDEFTEYIKEWYDDILNDEEIEIELL